VQNPPGAVTTQVLLPPSAVTTQVLLPPSALTTTIHYYQRTCYVGWSQIFVTKKVIYF